MVIFRSLLTKELRQTKHFFRFSYILAIEETEKLMENVIRYKFDETEYPLTLASIHYLLLLFSLNKPSPPHISLFLTKIKLLFFYNV